MSFTKQEQEILDNGGELCQNCGTVWEDLLAALTCPCMDWADDCGEFDDE